MTHILLRKRNLFFLLFISINVACLYILYVYQNKHSNKLLVGFSVTQGSIDIIKNDGADRCKWPPNSVDRLFDPQTGQYDLSLRPCVQPNVHIVDQCKTDYYNRLKIVYSGPSLANKSCLRQLVEMDKHARMNAEEPNYSLYPEMGNVQELVMAIKNGKSVKTIPTNDPPIRIVQRPRKVCSRNSSAYSQDLIVLIKTCVNCESQRKHARQTFMKPKLWGSFKVQFAFVLGMPASNQSKWAEFDGLRLRNLGKLFDNTTAALQTILNESVQYGDLLIGDFTDSYYNLTIKQVTTFRWISAFCRYTSALYLFIDNDYSLVPQNLIKMIQDIPDAIKLYLNGGTFGPARGVLRPKNRTYGGRYDVSLDEIPWDMYPQYSSGAAYMVGASLVTDAAIAMAYTRFLRIDDAYLGFVWDKLHVPILTIPGMLHTVVNFPHTEHVISLPSKEADQLVDWNTGRIQKKNITIAPELRDSLVIGG